jgi:hypothetical protein
LNLDDFSKFINILDAKYCGYEFCYEKRSIRAAEKNFLRSDFSQRGSNVTNVGDSFTSIGELGNLIKLIGNNMRDNDYIILDDCIQTILMTRARDF